MSEPSHQQPSAPTADVEKIASNAVAQWCLASRNWTGYDMPDQQQERLSEIMTKALVQAREPLVAALKDIAWGGNRPVDELRSIACVALGEKP